MSDMCIIAIVAIVFSFLYPIIDKIIEGHYKVEIKGE